MIIKVINIIVMMIVIIITIIILSVISVLLVMTMRMKSGRNTLVIVNSINCDHYSNLIN